MKPNIRPMKDSDIDKVYAIETSAHITPWSESILRDCVLVGYDCRVLEINNEIGGYIIARYHDNQSHILNLCIAKPLQSKGYGRQLLQTFLTSQPNHLPIHSILLEVRASNSRALHLYKSFGFKQTEIKKSYYQDADGFENAVLLKKTTTVSHLK